jgi:hypothetical protein
MKRVFVDRIRLYNTSIPSIYLRSPTDAKRVIGLHAVHSP